MTKNEEKDLKSLIYNSIPDRKHEDIDKGIFELVDMLKIGVRKQAAREACTIAAQHGCTDHRFLCAKRVSKAICDKFGL